MLTPPNTTVAFRDLPEDEHIGGYPTELQIAELGVDPVLLDSEGRCVCLEFPAFVLFGVYSPANSNGLRDDFRYGFLCALECRIRNLVKMGKRVILTGDLNVSRSEIDTASSADDIRKAGLTHEEYISTPNRRVFNQLIVGGEVAGERDEGREEPVLCDLVRDFHPQRKGMYTHWEQKINARPGNFGSRIDYVLVSKEMRDWFSGGDIQEGLMVSGLTPDETIWLTVCLGIRSLSRLWRLQRHGQCSQHRREHPGSPFARHHESLWGFRIGRKEKTMECQRCTCNKW